MSAGKKADKYSIDYVLLADDYLAYLAANLIQVAGGELESRIRTHLIILSAESSGSLEGGFFDDGWLRRRRPFSARAERIGWPIVALLQLSCNGIGHSDPG